MEVHTMKRNIATKGHTESARTSQFQLRKKEGADRETEPLIHIHHGIRCDTESRGYPTPRNKGPLDLWVDASEGFIPLWAKGTTLRWRFQERSINRYEDPDGLKDVIKELMGEALMAWGDAVPIKFVQADDRWDFEYVIESADDCRGGGCVLASAFFPGTAQQQLYVYPKMFEQSRHEQVDTLIHEFGHVFGLRHFFANISETAWPSEQFGVNDKFTIMNYGANSELTDNDKADLKRLYETAWKGDLTEINRTQIKFMKPFSAI
jgi:hypothetical protein